MTRNGLTCKEGLARDVQAALRERIARGETT